MTENAPAMPDTLETDAASAVNTVECELRGLEALRDALKGDLGQAFARAVAILAKSQGRIIVTGVGKSGHIARKIAGTLSSMGRPAHFLHPADASHGDLGIVTPQDIVIALSWSGESSELADIVAYTRRFSIVLIASTSREGSTLARAADLALVLPSCEEACGIISVPTVSTAMQLALGDALALALLRRDRAAANTFEHLHPGGRLGARLKRVRDLMHRGGEVPLIPSSASLAEAIVGMTQGRFGMIGVQDEAGSLIGIVTDGDLRRAFAFSFTDRNVTEAMSRKPATISPDDLAHAALALMNTLKITGLIVIEGNKPVGIVHIHDLLRAGVACEPAAPPL